MRPHKASSRAIFEKLSNVRPQPSEQYRQRRCIPRTRRAGGREISDVLPSLTDSFEVRRADLLDSRNQPPEISGRWMPAPLGMASRAEASELAFAPALDCALSHNALPKCRCTETRRCIRGSPQRYLHTGCMRSIALSLRSNTNCLRIERRTA